MRGRYASDGPFEPVHQMCGASIDGQDGYDTALWAAALPGSDGRLGVFGTSYPAWELALTRPPLSVPPRPRPRAAAGGGSGAPERAAGVGHGEATDTAGARLRGGGTECEPRRGQG